MDLRTIAIAMGCFLLIVGGFLAFVIISAGTGTADSPTTASRPHNPHEEYVLSGYEVKFWGEGRPFVSYYDPGAGEYATQDIRMALFWQANYTFETARLGGSPADGPYDGVEAAYRLGLISEHGLFGYPVELDVALAHYRDARMGGHIKSEESVRRLEAAR